MTTMKEEFKETVILMIQENTKTVNDNVDEQTAVNALLKEHITTLE